MATTEEKKNARGYDENGNVRPADDRADVLVGPRETFRSVKAREAADSESPRRRRRGRPAKSTDEK